MHANKASVSFYFRAILFIVYGWIATQCSSAPRSPEVEILGNWERAIHLYEASLEIRNITADSLSFFIQASSGAHTGELEGKAARQENTGKFVFSWEDCLLEFQLLGDTVVHINHVRGMCGAGMGVSYDGDFKRGSETASAELTLVELGHLKSSEEEALVKSVVGEHYHLFFISTQLNAEPENLDHNGARVSVSAIRGLYTYMENIIMIHPERQLVWAAVIDDQKVRYFTNDPNANGGIPLTIEEWRSRFMEYQVIQMNP